jgi:NB-ARC domain-containing protein
MAGVGKSALAMYVATAIAERFPDGQLYVDLRGSKLRPKKPPTILGQLLRGLGESGALPKNLDELTGMYRSRIFGRELLIVLDNAHDEFQLRNVLPPGSSCAAIVTSQRRISTLTNATFIDLPPLDLSAALSLLRMDVGGQRVASEPESAARIISLCSHVPLALRVVGATLAARPDVSLREYSD